MTSQLDFIEIDDGSGEKRFVLYVSDTIKKEIQESIEKSKHLNNNSLECGLYWCYCGKCKILDVRKIIPELEQENKSLSDEVAKYKGLMNEYNSRYTEILKLTDEVARLKEENKTITCHKDCKCHNGTPFDQCECICPYWCGEPVEIIFTIDDELQNTRQEIKQLKVIADKRYNFLDGLYSNQKDEIQNLKSQLEEKQKEYEFASKISRDAIKQLEQANKVITYIENRIKKIEDEYPQFSEEFHPSKTNHDYILLKEILSQHKQGENE